VYAALAVPVAAMYTPDACTGIRPEVMQAVNHIAPQVPLRPAGRAPISMRRLSEQSSFASFMRAYFRQMQRYVTTGIMVWVPLFITIWVSWLFVSKIAQTIKFSMDHVETYVNQLGERIPRLGFLEHFRLDSPVASLGTGFLLAVLLFLCTGFLTRYLIGRKIIALGELLVGKIPLISRVYLAVQQIRDVFVNRKGAVFQKVVLLEYPRKGILGVGFVTSSEQGAIQHAAGQEYLAIFVPTTPNPTSGFLLYLRPDEAIEVDMSVEDAMKLIVSGGAYVPDWKRPEPPGRGDAEPK
jgi:uncharacterized membrane protein